MAVENSIVGPSIGVVPFVVIVSDDQNDEAIAQGDEDVLVALSTLAGTYWPVHGIEVGGRQVWKQAEAVWPAKKPMVCYYEATGEVGWWFCTAVADSKARKQLDDGMIIAAYAAPTATMPRHTLVALACIEDAAQSLATTYRLLPCVASLASVGVAMTSSWRTLRALQLVVTRTVHATRAFLGEGRRCKTTSPAIAAASALRRTLRGGV